MVLVNVFVPGERLSHPVGPVGRRRSLVGLVEVAFAGLMWFPRIVHLGCLLSVGTGIDGSWSTVVMLFDLGFPGVGALYFGAVVDVTMRSWVVAEL